VSDLLQHISPGQIIGLDGELGLVWLQPDEQAVTALQQAAPPGPTSPPAVPHAGRMADGKLVEVGANLSVPQEATVAFAGGADSVGLFRTEFLFLGRLVPPTEAEQFLAYTTVAQTFAGRPVVIRTLDAGGDKVLSPRTSDQEPNPALGLRGIRHWLAHPALAKSQLRALLRTHAAYPLHLLLPMITTLTELADARDLMERTRLELQHEGVTIPHLPALGVMIETPAAVLLADQLARQVDFFSIGTNDLAQYVMAADRGNPRVSALVNPLQPSVIQAIRQVIQVAQARGIWVSICGEVAADPLATPLLIGLGVDRLSMNPVAIPAVKARLRTLTMHQAEQLAEQVLRAETVTVVETLLRNCVGVSGE
jgi:multiphosphoryl transfer protein